MNNPEAVPMVLKMARIIALPILLLAFIGCHDQPISELILFDFESDKELDEIHWECHTLFSLSDQYATHGTHSLKMALYPSSYPGFKPALKQHHWEKYTSFKFDMYNPTTEKIVITLRIDDREDANEYSDRYNKSFSLKPGMNRMSILLNSLKTSGTDRKLDLENIYRFLLFTVSPEQKIALYIDNIRLVC